MSGYEYHYHSIPKDKWKCKQEVPLEKLYPYGTPEHLTQTKRKPTMNHSLAVFLVAEGMVRALLCSYTEDGRDKKVVYKTFDTSIHKDDLVVVPTDTRHKMTVVKVVEEDIEVDMYSSTPVDWIVTRIDQDKFKEILAQEEVMLKKVKSAEKNKQRKELLSSLNMQEEDIKAISFNATPPAAA